MCFHQKRNILNEIAFMTHNLIFIHGILTAASRRAIWGLNLHINKNQKCRSTSSAQKLLSMMSNPSHRDSNRPGSAQQCICIKVRIRSRLSDNSVKINLLSLCKTNKRTFTNVPCLPFFTNAVVRMMYGRVCCHNIFRTEVSTIQDYQNGECLVRPRTN